MSNKYFYRATETDPSCLTPEGEELANKIQELDDWEMSARHLADDLEEKYPDESMEVRKIADKLVADSRELSDRLAEGR